MGTQIRNQPHTHMTYDPKTLGKPTPMQNPMYCYSTWCSFRSSAHCYNGQRNTHLSRFLTRNSQVMSDGGHTALLTAWGSGSDGFGHWFQLMCCACLLSKSSISCMLRVEVWGLAIPWYIRVQYWELSLRFEGQSRGEHRIECKARVLCLGSEVLCKLENQRWWQEQELTV